MRGTSTFWAAVLAAIALTLAGGGGGKDERSAGEGKKEEPAAGKEEGHNDDLIKLSDEEASRAGVKTETLEERQLADAVTVTGTIEPNRERIAHVLPRVPGRIVNVSAKLGDSVRQGQALATIESIEVGEAYSAHAQALADAEVAARAFERAERLHNEQIIPGKEYQRARAEFDKTRAQARAAADKLKMLGVTPGTGDKGSPVSRFPVTAPLAGAVIERKAVLGELASAEEPLFTVADLSTVWVEASIAEAQLGKVRPGAVAKVRLSAYPDQVFQGKVGHVSAVLDKETRAAKAIVALANPKGLLKPSMFASVSIETGNARKVLALPESAVTLVQGLPNVFIEQAGGFEARPVELGERSDGSIILKSGVKPGELVVTEGTYALKARLLKSQISSGHGH